MIEPVDVERGEEKEKEKNRRTFGITGLAIW